MKKILPFILFFLFLGNLFSQDNCSTNTEYYNCRYIQNDTYLTVLLSMNNPSQAEADALLQMYGTRKCQRRTVVLTPSEVEDCEIETRKEEERQRYKEEMRMIEEEMQRSKERRKQEIKEKIRKEELKLRAERMVNETFDKIQIYVYRNKSPYSCASYYFNSTKKIKKIIYFGSHKSTFHPYKIYWEHGNIKEEGVYFKHLGINSSSFSGIEEDVKRNRDYFSRTDSLGPKAYAFKKTYDKNGNLTYSQSNGILSTISSSFQKEIEEKTILLDTFVAKNTYLELKYGISFFSVNENCNVKVRELYQYEWVQLTDDKDFKFPSLEEMKKIISELKENSDDEDVKEKVMEAEESEMSDEDEEIDLDEFIKALSEEEAIWLPFLQFSPP
jgi:hypothetical protein